MHPVFHAALLSPYKQTVVHGPSYAEPPPELVKGEEEWEVEAILKHKRVRGGKFHYLVKWKDYPSSENSWEREDNIRHAKTILLAYKKMAGLPIGPDNETDSDSSDDET